MYKYDCSACGHENEDSAKFCGSCGKVLPEESTVSDRVGSSILGRYTIRRLIASGGMGVVYEAEQSLGEHHRTVAIKMLRSELSHDQTVVSRFNRECGIVAQLSHQNTVRVYDFGTTEDNTLYIAMEFVRGQSLSDFIGRGPLPVERTLGIVEQMCHALNEAHELGIVHRDLKPENVILTQQGSQPDFVKLLDFGIAVRLSAGGQHETKLTQQGIILGTPPYMSPEQFSGAPITRQSDLYSLGIIIYEALTGNLPFVADSPWMWAQRHLTSVAPDLPASFPPAIVSTIRAALAKDPKERPETALEMYELLSGKSKISGRSVCSASPVGCADVQVPKTQPDVPPLESAVTVPPIGTTPTVRTDHAGPPLMTNGTPVFDRELGLSPESAGSHASPEYQHNISPFNGRALPRAIPRRRGVVVGLVATVGLLLGAGGLATAYWLGALGNPFESEDSPNPSATSAVNSQTIVANGPTTVVPEVVANAQNSPEPASVRAKGAAANPGKSPRRGAPSAMPSSAAVPSADASTPPPEKPWPPLIPGFPASLPGLASAIPPLPTSIAGIPIPPLFPGARPSPSTNSSNELPPP
jgi:serine/threonine-protein kinase